MVHLSRWKVILLAVTLALGLLFSYANALSPAQREALPGWLPKPTLNLGLDLQGGSYLLLQVDVDAMREKRLQNLSEDARQVLSEAQIGVAGIARDGNGVIVTVSNPQQTDAAVDALRRLLATGVGLVSDRTVNRLGDDRIRYAYTDQALAQMGPTAVEQSIEAEAVAQAEQYNAQVNLPPPRVRVCRGRLFSPRDYIADITEWGFGDVVGKGLEERHDPIQ